MKTLNEELNRIKQLMGLITEQTQNSVIPKYVNDPRLVKILEEIEEELGTKFTDDHFNKEISLSGDIKKESGNLLDEVREQFEKMRDQSGCNDIFIKEVDDKDSSMTVSYRSYEDQKKRFVKEGQKSPQGENKIYFAMKRVSIPGYSQHHTGRSIDYGGNTICLRDNAWVNGDFTKPNKWGFTLPYMSGNIRMKEPWHLYYEGVSTGSGVDEYIEIKGINELEKFGEQIKLKTSGQSIDENSISLDMDKRYFKIKKGNTKIFGLRLRWNDVKQGKKCESCENTINKNPEYKPKVLKEVEWGDNRIGQIIVFYPK